MLSDVSFLVNDTDKLALVGPNGVGKTTLLRILAGELQSDGGEVILPRPIAIGYLPQVVTFRPGQTINGLIYEAHDRRFIQRFGGEILTLDGGRLRPAAPALVVR